MEVLVAMFGLVIAFGIIILVGLMFSLPLMLAWNYVMPFVFGLPEINFLHAWCLMIVSGMLIKSTLSTTKGK